MIRHSTLIPALVAALGAACLAPAQQPVDAVMAGVREAAGFKALSSHAGPIQLTGKASLAGTQGTFTLLIDPQGRFMQRIDGPVAVAAGSDGERFWVEDLGSERRLQQLGDREHSVLAGLILTGRWMAPDAPLDLALGGDGPEGAQLLNFKLRDTELAGTIEIDTATHRARKWSYSVAAATHTYALGGATQYAGITFPATIERSSSHGMSTVLTVEQVSDAPTFIRSPFEPVLSPPSDVAFDAGADPKIEVRKAPTGHLLVRPRIAGKDLGWFIFDSGAGSNCIDQRAVAKLDAEPFGEIPAVGVGGTTKSKLVRPASLTLGPATLDKPLLVVMNLAFLDLPMGMDTEAGEQISGIIGYNLLHRVVARIDMEAPAISIYDPAAFDASGITWSTLAIDGRVACVEGEFEGHKGWFHLDTGAGGSSIQLHAPAVERLKLLEGRTTVPTAQGGVGGMVMARQGVLKWFEIGGRRTEDVPATFATQPKGAFATPYTLGNIGGGLVKPFVLVMDYQHGRIAFVPRTP